MGAPDEPKRARTDESLRDDRVTADAATVEHERAERLRYLADYLVVERAATDEGLLGERKHADLQLEARDEFLANVSHDLRSLLGSLSLGSDALHAEAPAGKKGDGMRAHAARTKRLIARMNRLVGDLLDVGSIEAGRFTIVPESVDLAKLVRDSLDAFGPIAAAKHVTLDADTDVPFPRARLDGGRILQVLANLLGNAIKFTPAGGRVTLRVRAASAGVLELTVSDTGIGIASEALGVVFERFRQVRTDRHGLGLGLHISQRIIAAHGGRIWAESTVGLGTAFHVTLPTCSEPR